MTGVGPVLSDRPEKSPARAALVAVSLVVTWALTQAIGSGTPPPAPALGRIPLALAPWAGITAPAPDPDTAKLLAADQYVHRYYRGPHGIIEMDVAYYAQPRIGANMHSPLNCLSGNGWSVAHVDSGTVDTGHGVWPVRHVTVERGKARYAMTYWFQTRERVIASEWSARVYLLADALRRRPTDTVLVRVMVPAATDTAAQQTMLTAFAARLIPELTQHLN